MGGSQASQILPFAYGTSRKPVPVGVIPFTAGTTQQLKIPKAGFLSRLRFYFVGAITFGTAGTTAVVPLWNLIQNYSLANSLGYSYRNMSGDSLAFCNRIFTKTYQDPILGSPLWVAPNNASTTANQTISFALRDEIAFNDGLNFDKFMLSAQTLDNDLILSFTFAAITALNTNTSVVSALSGNIYVTAEYYTVPDVTKYALPDTSVVQQIIDDSTYTAVVAGDNYVHLTPIQGPEFLGVGMQFTLAGVQDPLTEATNVQRVRVVVNGTDTIMDWSAADLIQFYVERFGRSPSYGYLYLDFSDDLGMANAMGPVERLAFSTQAYSQIDLLLTLSSSATVTAPSGIKLVKRMQSEVAA